MAEWKVTPQWKKSIIERNYYHKDGATITAETGWRGGEFTVYTDDDNPPDIEAGVDMYNCEYETELVETFDGCWEDVTVDDEDLEEWLEEFLEENSYLDLEEKGWMMGDCEMIFDCDLIIERVDGDDAGQIIKTESAPTELTNRIETSTKWPFGESEVITEPLTPEQEEEAKEMLEEPAKWPFDRPYEGPKDAN